MNPKTVISLKQSWQEETKEKPCMKCGYFSCQCSKLVPKNDSDIELVAGALVIGIFAFAAYIFLFVA